jgi:thiol-disulfide isomerase/thioredoxin
VLLAGWLAGGVGVGAAWADASPLTATGLTLTPLAASHPPLAAGDLKGKVVYVDFWASWCAPCRASFPWLDGLYRKYGDQGLVVLGINKDQAPDDADKFLTRYPASFPLLRDPGDALAKGFAVRGMPSAYLIDRRGNIRHTHVGFRQDTAAELETLLVELLKESPT